MVHQYPSRSCVVFDGRALAERSYQEGTVPLGSVQQRPRLHTHEMSKFWETGWGRTSSHTHAPLGNEHWMAPGMA